VSNAARVWGVKLLQRRQNSEDAANACERRYRLDKLGVTGSRVASVKVVYEAERVVLA
jgi:hypothetical protein